MQYEASPAANSVPIGKGGNEVMRVFWPLPLGEPLWGPLRRCIHLDLGRLSLRECALQMTPERLAVSTINTGHYTGCKTNEYSNV